LLTKQKGRRGRPTLEAKRQSEMNPKKTIGQFWKEEHGTLPARFQVLDKEKPTILLDNASNLDAFKNLLLGIRLMHYQRPLKGLSLIIGGTNQDLDFEEFYKHNIKCIKQSPDDDLSFLHCLVNKIKNKSIMQCDEDDFIEWSIYSFYFNQNNKLILMHPR
jgi:hypothetical protein